MGDLRNALDALKPANGGLTCNVCEVLGSLTADDADALREALVDRRLHATMINKALENINVYVSVGSIRRHRRGECAAKVTA